MPLICQQLPPRITQLDIFITGNAKHQIPSQRRSYLPALQARKYVNCKQKSIFLPLLTVHVGRYLPTDTEFYTTLEWLWKRALEMTNSTILLQAGDTKYGQI